MFPTLLGYRALHKLISVMVKDSCTEKILDQNFLHSVNNGDPFKIYLFPY